MTSHNITILFITFLFLIPFAYASINTDSLDVSLLKYSTTFDLNEDNTADEHIVISNNEDFPVNISIITPTKLSVDFWRDTNFILEPNETKVFPYTITASKYGRFSDYVDVIISSENSYENTTLKYKINLHVGKKENNFFEDIKDICIDLLLLLLPALLIFSLYYIVRYKIFKLER